MALAVGWFGGRYLLSDEGRYRTAQIVFGGSPERLKPVLENALADAARTLGLPEPYPQLLCSPDSLGPGSRCRSLIPLRPGITPVQANAAFTRSLTDLGASFVSGAEDAGGIVTLTYRAGDRVSVALELLPATGTGLDTVMTPAPDLPEVEVKVRLALIIDDYGDNAEVQRQFAALPGRFTAAVRPNVDGARELAAQARQAGMEVILNLPLEPQNYPTTSPGPNSILVDLSGKEIRSRVRDALEVVGPVTGAKTYMGELAVEDRDVMRAVLEELAEKGVYLVDNTTSTYSTVEDLAREIGVQVFHAGSAEEVDRRHRGVGTLEIRFADLVKRATARGWGIGIIHSRESMIQILKEEMPRLLEQGIVVLPLTEVMKAHALE